MPAGCTESESQPPASQQLSGPDAAQQWTDRSLSCPGALPALTREPQSARSIFLCSHRANSGCQACTAKGTGATPRHRRTDQSQRTKHTMTTTRSKGLSPAPLGCGLCFAGEGGGGRGRRGEEKEGERAAKLAMRLRPPADPPGPARVPTTGRPSWTLLS